MSSPFGERGLHFFQGGDSLFDRGMGAEELVHPSSVFQKGIDDIEMSGGFVGCLQRLFIS